MTLPQYLMVLLTTIIIALILTILLVDKNRAKMSAAQTSVETPAAPAPPQPVDKKKTLPATIPAKRVEPRAKTAPAIEPPTKKAPPVEPPVAAKVKEVPNSSPAPVIARVEPPPVPTTQAPSTPVKSIPAAPPEEPVIKLEITEPPINPMLVTKPPAEPAAKQSAPDNVKIKIPNQPPPPPQQPAKRPATIYSNKNKPLRPNGLSLPVGYGGRFPVTPVAPELQPHLLASLSSTHPINNRSKIENRLFPDEKKAEVQHSLGSWMLQLKLATEALARAGETKDFDLLYSDMVFLRFNRVNLNWLLHYHPRLHTPPATGEIDGATMDELRDLQTAWLAYMSQWQKNSELYGKEMRDSMVSPLHLDADLELMKVILHPLTNQRKSMPPKSEQWSTINKAFFVSQLHERFPSVKLREFLSEEWLSRRYCSGQEMLTLRELQWLCDALRGVPAGLAFEPRHNRVVSGLRVGLLVHTEDETLSVADIYKALQPTLNKGKPSQRMNNMASGQNNSALDRPYNVLVAELHARMMLGNFGPAYQDVINWDYDHIGKLEINCQKLPQGLRTAWSEHWDYAIIVHCPPENKKRYTARLVDLVNFEEFEKIVFETERPWNFTPHTWFEPLAKLMRSLDQNIVLEKLDMVTNETIARRIENLQQYSNRESPSRLLVEFTFYQHAHKLQSNPLQGFAKDRPALANHLKLLNEGDSEQRAELVLALAQSLLGETFSMTWVGGIYPVP